MNYLLGSGYYKGDSPNESGDFAKVWASNLSRYTKPVPYQTVIVSVGDSIYPVQAIFGLPAPVKLLDYQGNLGHVHHLVHGIKGHRFGGWSASVLAMAMLAYTAELDFIYREQDVLAFGPYIEQMYSELGDGKMIFGSFSGMPCAQSLFLIKHDFIPTFVGNYIDLGGDRSIENLPEHKFARLEQQFTGIRRFKFGYDRQRPLNMDDPVWYAQRLTRDEISQLYMKGLL